MSDHQDDIAKKIADFLSLMIQVTKYEKDGNYQEVIDDKPACPNCNSAVCAMIQRNNDLHCWRKYAAKPEALYFDLLSKDKIQEIDAVVGDAAGK